MITNKTRDEIAHVARNGGGFVLDASRLTSEDLSHIARNLQDGATLHIANSDKMTSEQMAHVARNARQRGLVIFS